MKQKKNNSLKQSELNEKNKYKSPTPIKNNKILPINSRNDSTRIINLVGKAISEFPCNYDTNTYKNIKLKERLMKVLFQKGKKSKIKNKNGKILILDKIKNNWNKENISLISNINTKKNKKPILQEITIPKNNNHSMRNLIEGNSKPIKNMKFKTIVFRNNCIKENLKTLNNRKSNKLENELSPNEDNFSNVNGKRNKGIISFNNFIRNNSYEFKFKERNSSYGGKTKLCINNEDNNFNSSEKNTIITKNKSILLFNSRNYSRNNIFNEKNFPTSIDNDHDIPNNKNSLFFTEIQHSNNKNILKQDESHKSDKKEKKEIINKIPKKEKEKDVKEDKENKKSGKKRKNIFNEIFDEVKEEKNYVQKIVHMKLIEGMQLLRQNSHRQYNIRYNSKTYQDSNINGERNINIIPKQYNEKTEINCNDNNSTFFSDKTEKKIKSIKISNSCKNLNESRCVKIKKIKLDKLKNKLQKDSFTYHPRNDSKNININLSLNNKIININNNQKIYAPKKPCNYKKRSIQLPSIPFCYPKKTKEKFKSSIISPINSTSPILYKKPTEEITKDSCQNTFFNSLKPFNDSFMYDLDKIESNNRIVINANTNTNTNITNNYSEFSKPNIKYILYNRVKVKKDSNQINKINLNSSRYKTIRYIKKNKSKLKRIEDSLEKEKSGSQNKIIKTQEIQFGILTKNNSRKTINNEPINFNLNAPINKFNKQNSFINSKTFLSHDINDLTDIPNFDNSKKNMLNISQFCSNNGEENSVNTGTCKLSYNFNCDYDKFSNNNSDISNENMKLNYLKEELKGEQQIYYLLNFEDLLIIEDKLNLVLIVLEKGNKTFEEYFDLINYFFSSNLRNKFEQIFKYFKKETELMQTFVNYSLIFILICYDFAQNSIQEKENINNNFINQLIFQH